MSGKIFDWVMSNTDLIGEPTPRTTLVEIVGNKRILVEYHKGVTSYSRECIRIRSTSGLLVVSGEELLLVNVSKQQLVIGGCISSISLCKEND